MRENGGVITRYKFYISCVLLALLLLANLEIVNAIENNSNSKLSVYQLNPHYFQGMDGKPVFFASGGGFNPITGTEEFFDRMALYKMNYVRITSEARDPYRVSWPITYARVSGSGKTNFGFDKFDLTHFDQTYWDNLTNQLEMAEVRDIYVHISIFNHINYKKTTGKPWHWDGAAWNIDNDVNGDLIGDIDRNNDGDAIDWNEFYDVEALKAMKWEDLRGTSESDTEAQQRFNLAVLQRNYVDKYLNETSRYGNVFYEIGNELTGNPEWVQYWVDYIDCRVDNLITADGHIAMSGYQPLEVQEIEGETFHSASVSGDQLSFRSYLKPPSNAYSYNKGLIADTDGAGISDLADINRKGAWIAFTSGWLGWNNYDESTGNPDTFNFELYGYLRNLHNFISDRSIPFWEMAPHDELASSGRVLAAPSREYIIYLVSGGSTIIDLSSASSTFFVEWYNPKTGTYHDGRTVTGGGSESFTPPFSGDAVLHIVSAVFDTGTGTYPSIRGTHTGTIKPRADITVQKMYTYPCLGTGGHSEYVRIWNSSGTLAEGNLTGYEGDWHNISFSDSFTLKANETYNYTIRTGSYQQIIHKPKANVTGGTITCEEFVDANGKRYNDWIPAIKLYSTGVANASSKVTDDMDYVYGGSGGDTEPPTTDIVKAVLYNSYNSAVSRLFKALKSIKVDRLS